MTLNAGSVSEKRWPLTVGAPFSGTESAGINRHIVGDGIALVRRLNRRVIKGN